MIWLPPSEGKAAPASGPQLDLNALYEPSLTTARIEVLDALQRVSQREDAVKILRLGPRGEGELSTNLTLDSAPGAPAVRLFTGVLYSELTDIDVSLMTGVRIFSALFGVLDATDIIPDHRLAMGVSLPPLGRLNTFWRRHLQTLPMATTRELIIDCRSGAYQAALPAPENSLAVTVVRPGADGTMKVVSHFAKKWRGVLAREVLTHPDDNALDVIAHLETHDDIAKVTIAEKAITLQLEA